MYATEPYLTFNTSNATTKPSRRSQMISETDKYLVAQVARERLLAESSFKDHDLRRLVGHANLVDTYLAEHQQREEEKYAKTYESSIEIKHHQETEHVSAYIMQQHARNDGRSVDRKPTYASFTVLTSKSEHGDGREHKTVHLTLDYSVEIEETEVSEDDD